MTKRKRGFILEFLKERKTIGSILPSSRFLTKKILKNIDFKKVDVIVEYGPGTGVFTREIIKRKEDDTLFLIFELHEPFYLKLQEEFAHHKNVKVINDSALSILQYLKENNRESADVIISSLPLANFTKTLTVKILKSSKEALCKNGCFLQYQYTLATKQLLQKVFDLEKVQLAVVNVPPAFIYNCKKK